MVRPPAPAGAWTACGAGSRRIGGHLDVRRREQSAGTTFTVVAFVPVRGGAS
jgi:hypothetical protein